MAGIDGLIKEAVQRMYDQAKNDQTEILSQYQRRIQLTRNKIKAFKMLNEQNLLQDIQIEWGDDKSSLTSHYEAEATKILDTDTYRVAYGKTLLDGYHILTELGSYIRQSGEIKYSVTVTGLKSIGTYKITWDDMPFNEFANLVNFNVDQYTATENNKKYGNKAIIGGLRLKGVAKLFKQGLDDTTSLGQNISSGKIGTIYSWDSDQIDLYNQFVSRVKNINNIQWSDVNEGNLLEAFTRFQQNTSGKNFIGKKGALLATANSQILKAMKETMAHPKAFYKGGDINNLQLKGNQATIADSSTIENMLDSVGQSLTRIISLSSNLSQKSSMQPSISLNLEKTILNSIKQETKEFSTFIQCNCILRWNY